MEVLRKFGTIPCTCQSCKSKLQLEITDIQVNDCGQVHHGVAAGREYYVACPVCHATVPVFNVPVLWQKEIV